MKKQFQTGLELFNYFIDVYVNRVLKRTKQKMHFYHFLGNRGCFDYYIPLDENKLHLNGVVIKNFSLVEPRPIVKWAKSSLTHNFILDEEWNLVFVNEDYLWDKKDDFVARYHPKYPHLFTEFHELYEEYCKDDRHYREISFRSIGCLGYDTHMAEQIAANPNLHLPTGKEVFEGVIAKLNKKVNDTVQKTKTYFFLATIAGFNYYLLNEEYRTEDIILKTTRQLPSTEYQTNFWGYPMPSIIIDDAAKIVAVKEASYFSECDFATDAAQWTIHDSYDYFTPWGVVRKVELDEFHHLAKKFFKENFANEDLFEKLKPQIDALKSVSANKKHWFFKDFN